MANKMVPPSGGSLEIGNALESGQYPGCTGSSPFGGIPRNWKLEEVIHHVVINS